MCAVRISVPKVVARRPDWSALRAELHVGEKIDDATATEAATAASRPLPSYEDRTDLPFLTLDPAESMDLDQAMYLQSIDSGFRVHYAIADVAHFVAPGGLLDSRAHAQGETIYGPDLNVPLHPLSISEGAGSLLPGEVRPVVLWVLDLNAAGELERTVVSRALVQSKRRLGYEQAEELYQQEEVDPQLLLLQTIGKLRQHLGRQRGAVDLPTPEQEVTDSPDGPQLSFRAPLKCEGWNAQISLLTGTAAAALMIEHKVGLLRTLPSAKAEAVESLKLSARALGISWPEGASYGDVVSGIDPNSPNAAAFLTLATRLLRGAAYVAFNGEVPAKTMHSGVGYPYAHCTAPLRRLADRYVNEICLALCAGEPVPAWVVEALPGLPSEMMSAAQRSNALERATIEAAEAYVMSSHIGQTFDAMVVELGRDKNTPSPGATVQLSHPAVRARCEGEYLVLGSRIRVQCIRADLAKREVLFVSASG